MVFSSNVFLFAYLPITLIVYFLSPFKFRNLALFIVSLAFYGWGEPLYIFLMLVSIISAYGFGFLIEKKKKRGDTSGAKRYLIISIAVNLSFLLFFKYANFFITNLSKLPFLSFLEPIEGLKLPIGISFYTFQIMSYSIDLYRGNCDLQKRFVPFGTYVTLFPQLIAGPIVRYKDIDDQLSERRESIDLAAEGIRRFVAGLSKKVLLADTAFEICEYYKNTLDVNPSVLSAWMIVVFYTFQIYFDFSGYSDMAIGLGKIFGFKFLENFNYPYISDSITEFWRRWHISLSTWFKEYVYIPLGGNRVSKPRHYLNIAVVWFLTGFWHGANWNFMLWGAYFGLILIIEKSFLLKALKKIPAFFRHFYSVLLIMFGWMIFYFTDMSEMGLCFRSMFGIGTDIFADAPSVFRFIRCIPFLVVCIIACTPLPKRIYEKLFNKYNAFRYASPVILVVSLFFCIMYLVASSFHPFIYYIF